MAYAMLEIEFAFVDDTTKKMTFGPFATNSYAITGAKANIKAFNSRYTRGALPVDSWTDYFINENGAALKCYRRGKTISNEAMIDRNESEINLYD